MPELEWIAVVGYHLSRLIVVAFGGCSIVLGYRLFLSVPQAAGQGEARIELSKWAKLHLVRVAPGIFFAGFGAFILIFSLTRRLEFERQKTSDPAGGGAGPVVTDRSSLSSMTALAVSEPEANDMLALIAQLGRLSHVVDENGCGLIDAKKHDYRTSIRDAQLRLLESVWDEKHWGPHEDFRQWLITGERGVPSPSASRVARALAGAE